jgi:TolB-like protein/Tfp pilus assembly protein PilF
MPESGDSTTTQLARPHASDAAADAGRVHDVFVSYASQDAATASAIVAALERAGLHCWIAPRDVPPGSPYADSIIRAINGAKLLVLVLSEHAISSPHVGKEIERASSKQRPIIALRTDATPLTPALEYFLSESQWIDVGGGGTDAGYAKLVEAVQRLITQPSHHPEQIHHPEQGADAAKFTAAAALDAPANRRSSLPTIALIVLGTAALAYFVADKVWLSKRAAVTLAVPTPAGQNAPGAAPPASGSAPSAFAPPPHSIAVLPFVNMSGDPKQDYFSDGLSEELLNSLAAIPDLRVAARTSSFTFKGKNDDVADIARKLNVGAVLEGSVRKDGNQVRITAQLINATTGFHLWSQTYDRDLKNVLALQWEIATAVTKALKATLLTDAATSIEIGGTQNPAAFDAYLRGKHLQRGNFDKENTLARIAAFSEAARLDPKFAKAYVGAANAQNSYANNFAPGSEVRSWFKQARENSEKAIALAPELGEAHAAMAGIWERGYLDFARAQAEYDRALALSPNDTEVLLRSGTFFVTQGRAEAGLANIRSAIALDQLNPEGYARLSIGLTYAHQYREAIEADERTLQFNPSDVAIKNSRGMNHLLLGELDAARESCETPKRSWQGRLCMSILYDKLHRRAEAEAELAAMQTELGDSASYQYAEIYAQWGDIPKALAWLDTAYRLPDPGIGTLKVDSLVDPLRKEPRFQEIERKLKFPI